VEIQQGCWPNTECVPGDTSRSKEKRPEAHEKTVGP
jgi:hypothetical protein